ncbi:MAG: hypothetical protein MK082_07090 [Phycisphaerales bacterium]|nr:hypothetical protein [Phycisphaerales bacterium]
MCVLKLFPVGIRMERIVPEDRRDTFNHLRGIAGRRKRIPPDEGWQADQ